MLVLGCILKLFFFVLHFKIKFCLMYFSIAIDLIGKYKAQATARRRRSERTLRWTNWLVKVRMPK